MYSFLLLKWKIEHVTMSLDHSLNKSITVLSINSLNAKVAIIQKPVNWFVEQIKLIGFYMMATLAFNELKLERFHRLATIFAFWEKQNERVNRKDSFNDSLSLKTDIVKSRTNWLR